MFISSLNVFDFFTNYPSYENDKTFSNSIYGKVKINIENKILRMKLNLYPKQNLVLDHVAHNDFEEKNIGIKTAVFNFTTCNGGTTINNKFYK